VRSLRCIVDLAEKIAYLGSHGQRGRRMTDNTSQPSGPRLAARLLLACGGLLIALALAEVSLARRDRATWGSERLDPGLFRYDERLGWRTVPDWSGRHRHADYDVGYRTDRLGFRAGPPCEAGRPEALVAGDSFTFGYGVEDDDTFVACLGRAAGLPWCFLNRAVPGYSTDQEILLLEEEMARARPALVLLVVCLGNDLFDNLHDFPMQGDHAKPRFELGADGGLSLRNVPVPSGVKTPERAAADLAALFAEAPVRRTGRLESMLQRSASYRHLKAWALPGGLDELRMKERFDPALRLFEALVGRLASACEGSRTRLALVLLPGRSLAAGGRSAPSRYQEHLRAGILDARQYHPRDGHLTAEGHAAAAAAIAEALRGRD
jgi:hypothetical protein